RETDRRSGYPTEGLGVIDIAKHRNGPTGEIYFRHDKSMTKLVDYEPDLEWMKKNTTR
ncbi:replicative DNA helicase, partial [Bacteroides zhangwenhongii]|nr:replicative DNA helicase [Bacteroides zhangwenhongii]